MRAVFIIVLVLSLSACLNKKRHKYLGFYKEASSKENRHRNLCTLHVYNKGNSYFVEDCRGLKQLYWKEDESIFVTGTEKYIFSDNLNQITIVREGAVQEVYDKINQ